MLCYKTLSFFRNRDPFYAAKHITPHILTEKVIDHCEKANQETEKVQIIFCNHISHHSLCSRPRSQTSFTFLTILRFVSTHTHHLALRSRGHKNEVFVRLAPLTNKSITNLIQILYKSSICQDLSAWHHKNNIFVTPLATLQVIYSGLTKTMFL